MKLILMHAFKKSSQILNSILLLWDQTNSEKLQTSCQRIPLSRERPTSVPLRLDTSPKRSFITQWHQWWTTQIWWETWLNKTFRVFSTLLFSKPLAPSSVVSLSLRCHSHLDRSSRQWLNLVSDLETWTHHSFHPCLGVSSWFMDSQEFSVWWSATPKPLKSL